MAGTTERNITGPKLLVSRAITHSDNGSTVAAITVPANHFVPAYGVHVIVTELFAGGTPSMTVGDGSDTSGWLTSANITEATVGTYASTAGTYAITGKWYETADTIDVVVADTTLTDGTAYVIAMLYDLSGIDIADN